eukprot:PhF_6_TR16944/c0_g1_i1/m.25532/K10862/TDP1; tyrosyl-DNA phosphodiesterase 1
MEPIPFWLNKIPLLPRAENVDTLSLTDIVGGGSSSKCVWTHVVLSNFMTDIDWVMGSCEALQKVPKITIITGDQGVRPLQRYPNIQKIHYPPLPISYGTHHTKAILLFSPTGVRVCIHTANYILANWQNKTQGIWVQDFPRKATVSSSSSSPFGEYLELYFTRVGGWDATVLNQYDFTNATVDLVGSVPGYHTGKERSLWGMGRLKHLLAPTVPGTLYCQFSSMGSLDEGWLRSWCPGVKNTKLVFPTVDEVATSLEGWRAGVSIPVPSKNHKPFLKPMYHKWQQAGVFPPTPRSMAMPHVKSYLHYDEGSNTASWFVLSSANLSKAAWGQSQVQDTKLCVRSYELGVLYTPTRLQQTLSLWGSFTCTPDTPLRLPASTLGCSVCLSLGGCRPRYGLTLPYEFPPSPYDPGDEPWCNDVPRNTPDILDCVYPMPCEFYGPEGWSERVVDLTVPEAVTTIRDDRTTDISSRPAKRERDDSDVVIIS